MMPGAAQLDLVLSHSGQPLSSPVGGLIYQTTLEIGFMNIEEKGIHKLPIKTKLFAVYSASIILALLSVVACVVAILYQANTYPTDDLQLSFLPTDIFVLAVGIPMLLVSMWFTWRGKLIGLLLWPGALIFLLYINLPYIFALPINVVFLLHVVQVTLSFYALIGLLSSIDKTWIRTKLMGAIPERLSGGVLAVLGTLFLLRAAGVLVAALGSQASIAVPELALNISDFLIAPAWIICGVLVWRKLAFGYVASLGLLFQASMLFIGLIVSLLVQPLIKDTPLPLVDAAIVLLMGMICFVPFGLFIHGVVSKRDQHPV
jgi:hypothetical protein